MPIPVILLAFADYRTKLKEEQLRELGAEQDEITAALHQAEKENLCKVIHLVDASVDKITAAFSQHPVAIFHYSGHATGENLLMKQTAKAEPLAKFLGEQSALQLAFLNACSTGPQAQGLLQAGVPLVIATSRAINDKVARKFAVSFYEQLGYGKNVETAFAHFPHQYKIEHGENLRGLYIRKMPVELIDRVPWDLYHKPGNEAAKEWNLPLVTGNPLFGLPPIPPIYDLPERPFRYLRWFERKHAEVFFGRSHMIRELHEKLTDASMQPVCLLFGKTGVGKSSLLHAGLFPRLEKKYTVYYERRDPSKGLLGTLLSALEGTSLKERWAEIERQQEKPLIVILDQVEEVFHRPMEDVSPADELEQFTQALQITFGNPSNRPQGKLLLSYRKEYHAEIAKALMVKGVPRSMTFLEPLKAADVEAAVNGIADNKRCIARYGLTVEEGLPELIAHDLLADTSSAIAPVLQILLTNLWEAAIAEDEIQPAFTKEAYASRKRQGLLLSDFLDRQLNWLAAQNPEAVSSGLVLGLLHHFTTTGGTSDRRSRQDLLARYHHLKNDIAPLLQSMLDAYLLVESGPDHLSLAHDTLAPLVRERHELSDMPAQRTNRLLRSAMREYQLGAKSALLDYSEISIIEKGLSGRHALTEDEQSLLSASQAHAEAIAARKTAEDMVLVALQLLDQDPSKSFDLAKTAWQQAPSSKSFTAMHQAYYKYQYVYQGKRYATAPYRELAKLPDYIDFVDFHPSGEQIVSASKDQTVRFWDLEGNELFRFSPHEARIYSAKFSPDGSLLVTAGGDKRAKVWEVGEEMKLLAELSHDESVKYAEFSPNGELIVTASVDKTAKVWTREGKLIDTMKGHTDRVNFATFTPDNKYIITVSNDKRVLVWERFRRFGVPMHLRGAPRSRDIQALPIKHTEPILSCAVSTHQPFEAHSHKYFLATAAFDGTSTIYKDSITREFHTYSHGDYSRSEKADMQVLDKHTDRVHFATFSPDGLILATTSWDTTIRLWDLQGEVIVTLKGHEQGVFCTSFSPDGRYLVSASSDGRLLLWDLKARLIEEVAAGTPTPIEETFASRGFYPEIKTDFPDGSGSITYKTSPAQIYDPAGQLVQELPAQRGGGIPPYLAISSDSQYILLPKGMRACQVYDREGNSLCEFSGIEQAMISANFSEDDQFVFTKYEDGTVMKWVFRV